MTANRRRPLLEPPSLVLAALVAIVASAAATAGTAEEAESFTWVGKLRVSIARPGKSADAGFPSIAAGSVVELTMQISANPVDTNPDESVADYPGALRSLSLRVPGHEPVALALPAGGGAIRVSNDQSAGHARLDAWNALADGIRIVVGQVTASPKLLGDTALPRVPPPLDHANQNFAMIELPGRGQLRGTFERLTLEPGEPD